ncbi:PH domain-containing protein [Candidatus Micrarchaeota archaeon]|nr:PH domain-containing protein [Candidatus Micrarchaeota archaeon]
MVGAPTIVRRLSPNIKLLWLMPQILLVLLIWFIGTTFGLFASATVSEPIIGGIPNPLSVLLILLSFTGMVLVPSYLWADMEYKAYTYQLTENELVIRWGIVNRHRVVVPYEKIQDAKTDRTALERVLGLVTLKIETAGRSMNTSETACIIGISIHEREDLISDIMANVVIRRGEFSPESSSQTYHKTLIGVLSELKDISSGLRQEMLDIKDILAHKRRG